MDEDEDENKAKRIAKYTIGQELSELSVDELSETLEALQDEIKRLELAKTNKTTHLSTAAALFKT